MTNNKAIEVKFRKPGTVSTSQWIEPEEREGVTTDEKGYRILERDGAMFILEDNTGRGSKGIILIKLKESEMWACWAINKNPGGKPELDYSWIGELEIQNH